ncbi:MAG: O-methyltransferase [Reichenbachiella sp.]
MDFINKEILNYSENHTSLPSDLLNKIERETHVQVLRPRMLSGHLQGRILSMFSKMIKPQMALEIGTYTGYSALCIAEGLKENGRLITIDINEELESRVRNYFAESDFDEQIDFRIGFAKEIIPTIDEKIDLVFIDADKVNYVRYFDLVIGKMNKGGYIIADNVLWSGKVLDPKAKNDADTSALIEFNIKVHNDPRVENVLIPVRDGITVLRVV